MQNGRRILKRAGAVLCAALMLVFVQAAAASIVARVQHTLSGSEHHHMLFTDMSLDDDHHADHDADHHDTDHDADHASGHDLHHDGHQAVPHGGDGHHHHHGDVGANVMVLASPETAGLHALHDLQRPDPGRLIVEVRHFLPDRPPRAFSSQA